MKITLVLLTFNEIVGLRQLFAKIPLAAVDEAFAIDGGSTDGTLEFFREQGFPVHVQGKRGRGEAFRLAFEKTSGDALLFYSPDGNEDPLDIPRFRPLLENGYDMVVATRMVRGARNEEDDMLLKPRKWANNVFNALANMTWNRGAFVTDTINGFRAITKSAWQKLALDGPGYTIEYQSSIRAFKLGLSVAEFPTYEGARLDGREGSPSMDTGVAFLKMFFSELRVGKAWRQLESRTER